MKKYIVLCAAALSSALAQAQLTIEKDEDPFGTERIICATADQQNSLQRKPYRVGTLDGAAINPAGSPRVPVLLVQFADRKFEVSGSTEEEVRASFDVLFNSLDAEEVQNRVGNVGSVRSFFIDQSDSVFSPQFDIIGPVTLDREYSYYGTNSGSSHHANIQQFYKQSLTKAVRELSVDWSLYDNNANGTVDMVFYIYAGWGENTVSAYDPGAIWPHESAYSTSITMEGGDIITFSCMGAGPEARYVSKSKLTEDAKSEQFGPTGYNVANLRIDGVGTAIHEMSHAIGLPDLYDTSSSATPNFGMDAWSTMDYGCYTYGGRWPCG
ncbi:MAG: immune inhibitor A, partial [Bacteroidaceae bacterium]|nr:immune inhibitor A [Bacteroidaceae bacterium]